MKDISLIFTFLLVPKLVIGLSLTFPSFLIKGTKWCGPGRAAKNYDDLGYHKGEDMCCREHDLCDSIPAGATKHGLSNAYGLLSKMHCNCEMTFKRCLIQLNTTMSHQMGEIYFTGRNRCFQKQHPITSCEKRERKRLFLLVPLSRCVDYKLDHEQEKVYQWFDLPFFNSDYWVKE